MKLPMNPLIATMISSSASGGTYSILRYGWDGTHQGSILAAVIFGMLTFGALIVKDGNED
jgi:hypothetical protein